MSRQLKFRAYLDDSEEMFYRVWLVESQLYVDLDDKPWDVLDLDDQVHIMQYIGLKDKNGKEIYEGDILRHKFSSVGVVQYKLSWGAYFFSVRLSRDDDGKLVRTWQSSPFFNSSDRYVVIGNIYENPELIQEVRHDI